MEKLQRENENNKQLYKSLLKDYEDALYQLAEARLHIDRLRFGAEVDINKHYIITHSKQDQGDPNAKGLSSTRKEREMEACSGLINSIGDVQSRLNQLHEATARSEESPAAPVDAMNSELLDILKLHERLSNELAPFLKEKESENSDYVKNELSALGKQLEDFITLLQEREKKRAQDSRGSHESSYVPPITSIKNQFDELYLHSTSESAESEVDGSHGMSIVVKPLSSCPKYNAWLSNNNDDESSSDSDGIYGGNAEKVINGRQNTPSTAGRKIASLSKGKASLIPRPVRVARSKKMDTNPESLQHRQKPKPTSKPSKIPTYKGKVFNKGAQPSKIPKYKGNAKQKENIGASKPQKHQAGPETVFKNARPPENEDKQDLIQLRNEISDLIKELGHLNPAADSRSKAERENEAKGNSKTSKSNRNEMERNNSGKGSKQSDGNQRAATSRLSPNPVLSVSDKSMMTIPPLIAEKCTQMPSTASLPSKAHSKRRDRERFYHIKYYSSSTTSLSSLEDSEAVFDKRSRKKIRNRLRDMKNPQKKKTRAKGKKTRAYLSKCEHSSSSSSSCTSIEKTSAESMESAVYHRHRISPQRKKLHRTKLHHIHSDSRPLRKTVQVYSCVHPQNLEPVLACSHSCAQGPNLTCSVCSCDCHSKPPDLIPQKSTNSHKSIDLSEAVELAQGIKNSSERMNKRLVKILIGGGEH